MKNPFKQKIENIEPENEYENIEDGIVVKKVEENDLFYRYEKCVTIGDNRYVIRFVHNNPLAQGEFDIDFSLTNTRTLPITNAGLETFGKLVDEMTNMYEEISKKEEIKKFCIYSSPDNYTKDTEGRVFQIIEEHPEKLNGLNLIDKDKNIEVNIINNIATVKTKNRLGITSKINIPVSSSLMSDFKHIAKIDMSYFLTDILGYIQNPNDVGNNKKQNQRSKLYEFYLKKRFPKFNVSRKTVGDDGYEYLEVLVNK